jgi:hypothetical protein
MVIVSTREFRDRQKKYFDLAENETVLVKRGKKFVNLFVTDKPDTTFINDSWLKEFFAIPEEYRCNPFEISPSGDLFWADKRNVDYVQKQIAISEQQYKEGKYTTCKTIEEVENFLDSL